MRSFLVAPALLFFMALTYASQSSNSSGQSGSDTTKSVVQSDATSAPDPTVNGRDKDGTGRSNKKPKKVWTNDEISTAGASGGISIVGNSSDTDTKPSSHDDSAGTRNASSLKEKQITAYRDRLHQLRNELETTEKQISELRNFKAENATVSGGINMKRRYSMAPIEDQVKRLEEKKKQIQIQLDTFEDEARKKGIEPGELR